VPATNKRCEIGIRWIGKLSPAGLVVEDHTYYDVAGMLEQLGLAG